MIVCVCVRDRGGVCVRERERERVRGVMIIILCYAKITISARTAFFPKRDPDDTQTRSQINTTRSPKNITGANAIKITAARTTEKLEPKVNF